jgi:hypothetical protein
MATVKKPINNESSNPNENAKDTKVYREASNSQTNSEVSIIPTNNFELLTTLNASRKSWSKLLTLIEKFLLILSKNFTICLINDS